jgi:beta-lactamase superfamily II metal-dependent hydrolase
MMLHPRPLVALGLLASLALGFSASVRAATDLPVPAVYEAESATRTGEVTELADATASAGKALHLGKPATIAWTISLPRAGRYELHLRYRARAADTAQVLRINGTPWGVGFVRTDADWLEVTRIFPFGAGPNRVEFVADSGDLDLDCLRFTTHPRDEPSPVYELPVISPRLNTAYASAPRDLTYLLQLNGHRVESLHLDGAAVAFTVVPYPLVPDAVTLTLAPAALAKAPPGRHQLLATMEDGSRCDSELTVEGHPVLAPLVIVTCDVRHGKATLLRLPDGSVALIDTGTAEAARDRLVPLLQRQGIKRIDHLILTHDHDDHVGGRPAVAAACTIGQVYDCHTFKSGDKFVLGGVAFTVLNAADSGTDENSGSLALRGEYNGFVYSDGADTYGANQRQALARFPELVRADVYYANHHFHGSIDVGFLRQVDPVLVLVSAEDAVYARGAFMQLYKPEVEGYLKAHDGRLRETLVTREVGTIVVRARGRDDWTYETYADTPGGVIPGL